MYHYICYNNYHIIFLRYGTYEAYRYLHIIIAAYGENRFFLVPSVLKNRKADGIHNTLCPP